MNTETDPERTHLDAIDIEGREYFVLVTFDWKTGNIKDTSLPTTEATIREDLKSRGMSDPEIEIKLVTARKPHRARIGEPSPL